MAYRLQNAQTLRVSARGFGVKDGQYCMSESGIGPVRVNPNDILTVYPLAVAGGTAYQRSRMGGDNQRNGIDASPRCGCR